MLSHRTGIMSQTGKRQGNGLKTDEASQDHVRTQVNQVLDQFCQQQIKSNANHTTSKLLWQTLTKVVAGGGRRMRPYLVALAYQGCGGKANPAIIQVGAGWEMLHQGLLMHDDIIDRDYIRHGQRNVAGEYRQLYSTLTSNQADAAHYANSAALLAGDLALSSAYQLVLTSNLAPEQKLAVSEILGQAASRVCGGELQDSASVMDPIGVTDSLEIAELKTASYSFVGPLQTGALLAGTNQAIIKKFTDLGIATGIAFQLKDDLLGLFGDTKSTGKSNDGDVREGKRTLLLKYAYQAASKSQKQLIDEAVGNPRASNRQIQAFRDVVVQTGAKKQVEAVIQGYARQAQAIVETIPFKDDRFISKWLVLTEFITERDA